MPEGVLSFRIIAPWNERTNEPTSYRHHRPQKNATVPHSAANLKHTSDLNSLLCMELSFHSI